jgi:hypothetical protein
MTGVDCRLNKQQQGTQPVIKQSYVQLGAIAFCLTLAGSFSAQPQSDWATYTNGQYHFSLHYARGTSSVQTDDYKSRYPFRQPPVAFVSADIPSADTKGYLTINVSGDTDVVAKCSHAQGAFTVADIHSVKFIRSDSDFDDSDGFTRDYDTIHNGMCYRIEIITFASACVNSGCAGSRNQRWSRQSMHTLLEKLDRVAQTFQFSPSEKP